MNHFQLVEGIIQSQPLPPLPPGLEDIIWLFIIVISGIFVILLIVYIIKHFIGPSSLPKLVTSDVIGKSSKEVELEALMKELLKEIRLLRKEIEELRKEMKE